MTIVSYNRVQCNMHRNVTVTGTYSSSYYSIAAPTTELVGPALGGGTCDVCLQLTLLHAREGIVNGGLQTLGWDVVCGAIESNIP